jgi:hypothetical protein
MSPNGTHTLINLTSHGKHTFLELLLRTSTLVVDKKVRAGSLEVVDTVIQDVYANSYVCLRLLYRSNNAIIFTSTACLRTTHHHNRPFSDGRKRASVLPLPPAPKFITLRQVHVLLLELVTNLLERDPFARDADRISLASNLCSKGRKAFKMLVHLCIGHVSSQHPGGSHQFLMYSVLYYLPCAIS